MRQPTTRKDGSQQTSLSTSLTSSRLARAAVVAEVDEEDTEAVDERLQALGATVLRRDLSDLADQEYEHESKTIWPGRPFKK